MAPLRKKWIFDTEEGVHLILYPSKQPDRWGDPGQKGRTKKKNPNSSLPLSNFPLRLFGSSNPSRLRRFNISHSGNFVVLAIFGSEIEKFGDLAKAQLLNMCTRRPSPDEETMERFHRMIDENLCTGRRRSIIKVPPYIKSSNPDAYIPHVVSIGPYHHGTEHLMPMEAYKRKCVASFMQRSRCDRQRCCNRLWEETPPLMEYYEFLDNKWRQNEDSFFELMLVDGCFLLECFHWAIRCPVNDFPSPLNNLLRGARIATIRRDMMLIENQLPIQVLKILLELFSDDVDSVFKDLKGLIRRFFAQTSSTVDDSCVHLPDVLRVSMITPVSHTRRVDAGPEFPSATVLFLAGLKFEKSSRNRRMDIFFDETRGHLRLPFINVDEITETWFLNLMALERCEVMESNGVSSYISFMGMLIRSAQDVKLLRNHGIIIDVKLEKSDEAIAKLFTELAKNPVNNSDDSLYGERSALHEWSASSRRKLKVRLAEWGSNFVETYCKNPWSVIGLVAGTILLVATVTQTVYAVLQFYQREN